MAEGNDAEAAGLLRLRTRCWRGLVRLAVVVGTGFVYWREGSAAASVFVTLILALVLYPSPHDPLRVAQTKTPADVGSQGTSSARDMSQRGLSVAGPRSMSRTAVRGVSGPVRRR